ncbi:hypothetical protein ACQ4LE_001512 [Meloidogyne hapla]
MDIRPLTPEVDSFADFEQKLRTPIDQGNLPKVDGQHERDRTMDYGERVLNFFFPLLVPIDGLITAVSNYFRNKIFGNVGEDNQLEGSTNNEEENDNPGTSQN